MNKHSYLLFLLAAILTFHSRVDAIRNCSCVAFRLDDIQDYHVTVEQQAIIETFRALNASLTVGVIGDFFGLDANIGSVIQNGIDSQDACFKFEVSNHGWQHEDFRTFNLSDQITLMNNTMNKVESMYGIRPKTFMPPFHAVNEDTKTACRTLGVTHLTSSVDLDPPPYDNAENGLWRYPILPATGTISDDLSHYYPSNINQVWADIQYQLRVYGFAVVMMHPYEFTEWVPTTQMYTEVLNQTFLNEVKGLVNTVKLAGLRTVTVNEIDTYFNPATVQPCPAVTALTTSPITTSPVTTASLTTAQLTTSHLTTSPLTSGVHATTGSRTTGGNVTTGRMTTGASNPTQPAYTTDNIVEESSGWRFTITTSVFMFLCLFAL